MNAALEIHDLRKAFGGVHAVDRLSLAFEAGKITGVIGPNGSGKSTLVNLLTGVLPADGGAIVVGGEERRKLRPYDVAGLGVTRTFQDVRLFEQMTVLDNLLVVLTDRSLLGALFERHGDAHLQKARAILERVGLIEKQNALARTLSYGQRKLLEVGRALAMDADVVLFDEPFAGMFPEMVKIVAGVMRELAAAGKCVVLVEHNMPLIRELSDRVVVMDAGALLAAGSPEEVLSRRDVIDAYLGE